MRVFFPRRSLGPRSVPRFKRYLKVHITRINPSAITSLIFSEDGRRRRSIILISAGKKFPRETGNTAIARVPPPSQITN